MAEKAKARQGKKKKRPQAKPKKRIYDERRDTTDFRDRMFIATLVDVPSRRPLEIYQTIKAPIFDQASDGARTGFGPTMANYLTRVSEYGSSPPVAVATQTMARPRSKATLARILVHQGVRPVLTLPRSLSSASVLRQSMS